MQNLINGENRWEQRGKDKKISKRERWRSLELFASLPQFTNAGFSPGAEIRPKRAQSRCLQEINPRNLLTVRTSDDVLGGVKWKIEGNKAPRTVSR